MTYWVLLERDCDCTEVKGVVNSQYEATQWLVSGTNCDYEGPFELGNPDN